MEDFIVREKFKQIIFISSGETKDKVVCKNKYYEKAYKKKKLLFLSGN